MQIYIYIYFFKHTSYVRWIQKQFIMRKIRREIKSTPKTSANNINNWNNKGLIPNIFLQRYSEISDNAAEWNVTQRSLDYWIWYMVSLASVYGFSGTEVPKILVSGNWWVNHSGHQCVGESNFLINNFLLFEIEISFAFSSLIKNCM